MMFTQCCHGPTDKAQGRGLQPGPAQETDPKRAQGLKEGPVDSPTLKELKDLVVAFRGVPFQGWVKGNLILSGWARLRKEEIHLQKPYMEDGQGAGLRRTSVT